MAHVEHVRTNLVDTWCGRPGVIHIVWVCEALALAHYPHSEANWPMRMFKAFERRLQTEAGFAGGQSTRKL